MRSACLVGILLLVTFPALGAEVQDPSGSTQLSHSERVERLGGRTWEMKAARVQGELQIDGRVNDEAPSPS